MRYWCEFCEVEFIFHERFTQEDIGIICPCCKAGLSYFYKIPDFETPAQYEKRTGKKWNGALWAKGVHPELEPYEWLVVRRSIWKDEDILNNDKIIFLCANNSPEPPPDDYVPEVEA